MGWYVARPIVRRGEKLLWNVLASREQTFSRYVGGRLFVTQRRLIFQPNRLERLIRGTSWSAPLANIAEVGVSPRRLTFPLLGQAAANRNRLKIVQRNGDVDLFVVSRLSRLIARLTAALPQ